MATVKVGVWKDPDGNDGVVKTHYAVVDGLDDHIDKKLQANVKKCGEIDTATGVYTADPTV